MLYIHSLTMFKFLPFHLHYKFQNDRFDKVQSAYFQYMIAKISKERSAFPSMKRLCAGICSPNHEVV